LTCGTSDRRDCLKSSIGLQTLEPRHRVSDSLGRACSRLLVQVDSERSNVRYARISSKNLPIRNLRPLHQPSRVRPYRKVRKTEGTPGRCPGVPSCGYCYAAGVEDRRSSERDKTHRRQDRSAAQRKLICEVELSGVLKLRAATL
jgi:hypothetical protein